MAQYWYGWIPLLTKDIPLKFFIDRFKRSEGIDKIEDTGEINSINKILFEKGCDDYKEYEHYTFLKKLGDPPKKDSIVRVLIRDNLVCHVILSNEKDEIKCCVRCEIKDRGLVKMDVYDQKVVKLEKDYISQIYIIIRDIYHHHTHHKAGDKHGDILLEPVLAENKKEGITKINREYQNKIITHHKDIKGADKKNDPDIKSQLITTAKGEMIYALSFLERFRDYIDDYEQYKFTYENSLRSMNVLEDTDRKILHLTNILSDFTIVIGVISIIMAISASISIVDPLENNTLKILVIVILWVIVIVSVGYFIRNDKKIMLCLKSFKEWRK